MIDTKTNDILCERYHYWNHKAFDGKLPSWIRLGWKHLRKHVHANAGCYVIRNSGRIDKTAGFSISVNKAHLWTLEKLDAVLLHEMVHIQEYTELNYFDKRNKHGVAFESRRKIAEQKAGVSIPGAKSNYGDTVLKVKTSHVVVVKIRGSRDESFFVINSRYISKSREEFLARLNLYGNYIEDYRVVECKGTIGSKFPVKRKLGGTLTTWKIANFASEIDAGKVVLKKPESCSEPL